MKMQKALFLDRDGTLNVDIGYAYKAEDCRLVEQWIWEKLKKFRQQGYLLVIITNQAWIDKWYYEEKDLFLFMDELGKQLDIKFDGIYFSPFHPDFSWDSECRKPNNWMILRAKRELDIDLENSYMIWDNYKDVEAWIRSWTKTILLNTQNLDVDNSDIKPDFTVNSWDEIEKIINN